MSRIEDSYGASFSLKGLIRPIYNVKDYGPAGDGVADSTAAINAAILASPDNSIIYFPRGTYQITSTLNIGAADGRIFMGERGDIGSPTLLKWTGASGGGPIILIDRAAGNADSCGVMRMKLDGNNLANICLYLKVDTGSAIQGPILEDIDFKGYLTRGLVLGIDDVTGALHAGQIGSLYSHHLRFEGSTGGQNVSYGMVVNAQNGEWLTFHGLRFDPPNGSEHSFHIWCRAGAIMIEGLVTTRSVTYAIYSKDMLIVNGWRAEEQLIYEEDSVDPLGPCVITGLQHRFVGAVADSILYRAPGAHAPLIINGARMNGNVTFGPTDVHNFILNEVEFDQGIVNFQGPTKLQSGTWTTGGRTVFYKNGVATVGLNFPNILGLDNRSGVTVADGSPIVLYAVPAGANQLFDAALEIDATAFTSGTATYTMTYTENGVSQTIVVTATVINVVTGVRRLIQPDASTNVTVQLTGPFVATCRLSAALMQLA